MNWVLFISGTLLGVVVGATLVFAWMEVSIQDSDSVGFAKRVLRAAQREHQYNVRHGFRSMAEDSEAWVRRAQADLDRARLRHAPPPYPEPPQGRMWPE